ncbi:MAG: FAD-dependent oxidoreductase [Rhodanobacteraceae bacterium]|nr:MAG: FAD-dependent oxidoreductase [Rhodanobacteraceae bacterium]
MEDMTPAVVLGAGANGLGVARSLARARVPTWLLDTDARQPEMFTRAAKPLALCALHGEALIEDLERLAGTVFGDTRPVLFLTQEETVRTVSRFRERLVDHYRFALPAQATVDALQHKQGFQQLAEQHAAPIPPLVHVRTPDDLPGLGHLHYPVVVKPGGRDAAYSRQFKKAYRVEDLAQASELVGRILPVMPDVVVQEWIDGPDSNIYFCLQYLDRQGQLVASFTGRKIRSWPPQTGGTASCTAAPEAHAELSRLTEQFFRATGVVGMASMEYKRDARSGAFRMVEPTIGRTDYQEEVATLNGVNLPHAAWCSELDKPFPAPMPAARVRVWRVRSEDQQSAAAQQQPASLGMQGASVVDALWRGSDPVPGLLHGWRRVQRALQSRTAKVMPGSQTAGSKP